MEVLAFPSLPATRDRGRDRFPRIRRERPHQQGVSDAGCHARLILTAPLSRLGASYFSCFPCGLLLQEPVLVEPQ